MSYLHNKFHDNWISSFWGEDVNARRTTHDDGRQPIAKGHLSDSGDLKIFKSSSQLPGMFCTVASLHRHWQAELFLFVLDACHLNESPLFNLHYNSKHHSSNYMYSKLSCVCQENDRTFYLVVFLNLGRFSTQDGQMLLTLLIVKYVLNEITSPPTSFM